MQQKKARDTCYGCRYNLGGGCCKINSEKECREGGGYELYESWEENDGERKG